VSTPFQLADVPLRCLLHRRLSQNLYRLLQNQQRIPDRTDLCEYLSRDIIKMASMDLWRSGATSESYQRSTNSKQPARSGAGSDAASIKLGPWTAGSEQYGCSAQLVAISKGKQTSYRAGIAISLLGKLFSMSLQVSSEGFSLCPTFRARNITPFDSDIVKACRAGDFSHVRDLLTSGLACGSDVDPNGWPVLEVSA
jgi:hypothetical protein